MDGLSADLLQLHIFSRLNARSLARCRLVCRSWETLASADSLWRPLLAELLGVVAQLPLQMFSLPRPIQARTAYNLLMDDTHKHRMASWDLCGRTWVLNVKPDCGPYWYSLARGGEPLVRFFHCDGSLTAMANDPVWGNHESAWQFVSVGSEQYIKINFWPILAILRMQDGRWMLENEWATYTTMPDLYVGTGLVISKTKAPPCAGCSYPRLMNSECSRGNIL